MTHKRLLFIFSIFLCTGFLIPHISLSQETEKNIAENIDGYHIHIAISPYKNNDTIFLASYYGKSNRLVDTTVLNENDEGDFIGPEKLPQGIYFLVSQEKSFLFEILMDDVQQFSIKGDARKASELVITGSTENELFAAYTRFLGMISPRLNAAQQSLKAATTKQDSAKAKIELKEFGGQLNSYRDSIIQKNPNSMLATFLNAAKIPEFPQPVNGDSLYPFYYVKTHYWDNVDFFDDKLLRTPFFDKKLEDYYKYYVDPQPDSVIKEVNYMLLSARESKEMFHYLLGKFTDKYINPEIMGLDKVFLFLFENYYAKGDTAWLSSKQNKYIFDRAYSVMANQINEQAAPLNLIDTSGKPVSLFDIKSPYIFLAFWDPHCSHCKEKIPVIDSLYHAKWKSLGVTILGVNVNENEEADWKKFIVDHNLEGWLHAWFTREQRLAEEKTGQADYRQLYDVQETPTFFLLDEKKRIIAKKLSLQQFDELLSTKLSKQNN
ncbi:MAG: redoxin domain-containing protein [Parafilimonas sp.]